MTELLKELLDSRQAFELAERFWQWIQLTGWRSPRIWFAMIVVGVPVASYFLIAVPRKLLEGLIGLKESWKKIEPRSLTLSQKDFLRRRSQFCRALRSDLDTLNKAESWNDQFFTDLEADIEMDAPFYASRLDKLFRRKTQGLRRVPSLMDAIESSTERWQLLVGEPGSGKSVALRHLAHQLAEQGVHSADSKQKVPLYINLKELPPAPAEGPSADWIRQFVIDNVRRGDADTAEYVKSNWNNHLKDGIWFFLFDSFDEIPAVMHAPIGSTVIEHYAEALRHFLTGMNECRGLIASREFKGPTSLPWHKLRILPLSLERQDQLIENTFLTTEEKETTRRHLLANSSSLRHTPQFLSLLCRFIQQYGRPPSNDHDLLWRYISRLSERDIEYTQGRYGLSPTQLVEGAMKLAVLFASVPTLSLSPTYDQIAAALPTEQDTSERLERLLAALVYVKIGRSDVPEARKGDRRFTFSHRRYQETLFVRYLSAHPHFLSPNELLLDPRWREYTVALLQSESGDVLTPLLRQASGILIQYGLNQNLVHNLPGFGEGLGYFEWSHESEVHLLALLQEGLARRIDEIPAELSSALTAFLSVRWDNGDLHDRTMALRLGGLIPEKLLVEYLRFAVEKGSFELQDEAFQKIVFIRKPPSSLMRWVGERLGRRVLFARTKAELIRTEALCARLPQAIGADAIRRRCMWLKRPLAPLVEIARALTSFDSTYAPPIPVLDALFPDYPGDSLADALLGIMVFLLNGLGIAFGLSSLVLDRGNVLVNVLNWLPEVLFSCVGIVYLLRNGRIDQELNIGTGRALLFAIILLLFVAVFLLPFVFLFLGVLNRSWLLLSGGCLIIILVLNAPVRAIMRKVRVYRQQQARLSTMLGQTRSPPELAPQAQSLVELNNWMNEHRKEIVPDERHARSLSSLIIHGIEAPKERAFLGPPLLVYCASGKWTVEETQTAFNHIQRALMSTPPP